MTAIIITGRKRGGPQQLAGYLLAKGENEAVRVRQIGGFVAKDIREALLEMWAVADGSKAKDFLYHASINPRKDAKLSPQQWRQAVDMLEKNLNLVGHQRVVVEHIKDGRTHYHVVWNRVNPLTGRTKKLSFDRRVCRATALELGDLFKLEPTANKGQSYKRGEFERSKRTGIDPRAVRAEVTALWNNANSGKAFTASLAKHGYILARGDRNQFVIIDRAGSVHGLSRRIDGATAKIIRRGLADIVPSKLPTVAEARRQVKAYRGSKTSSTITTKSRIGHKPLSNRLSANVSSESSTVIKASPDAIVGNNAAKNRQQIDAGADFNKNSSDKRVSAGSSVTKGAKARISGGKPYSDAMAISSAIQRAGDGLETTTSDGELAAILTAIADEVQGAALGAKAAIMAQYAGRIDDARKNLPSHQIAGVVRALIEARTVEIKAVSCKALNEIALRRIAAMQQRCLYGSGNKRRLKNLWVT